MDREQVAAIVGNMYGDSVGVGDVFKIVSGMWDDCGTITRTELLHDWRSLSRGDRALWPTFADFLSDCMVENGGQLMPIEAYAAQFGRVGRMGR